MNERQLIADLLSALEYHTEQTRPIEFSRVAIEAAREYLRKPAQQQEPDYHICPTFGGMTSDPIVPPARQQELCPSCKNGDIYACTCTFKPAQQEPVAWPIDGDTAKRIADRVCVSYETVQQVARELAAPQPAQQQEPEGWNPSKNPMTAERAAYFMRRFKHEEKLLGPNEQSAVDYVIAMLEQPAQQEPVAEVCHVEGDVGISFRVADIAPLPTGTKLYTSPPAQRKPLTDEDVEKIIKSNMSLQMNLAGIRADFEAALGIKGDA